MELETTITAWQAGELHALADLLADLTPGALAAGHLDQPGVGAGQGRGRARPGGGDDCVR